MLFNQVLNRFVTESHELKRVPYSREVSLEKQLGMFADAMWEPTRNPIWLGLMKVISTSPDVVETVLARVNQEEDTLASWLRAAHEDQRVVVENPEFVASVFWAMLSGAFMMPAIFSQPLKPRQAAAMKAELVHMFLTKYVAPPTKRKS